MGTYNHKKSVGRTGERREGGVREASSVGDTDKERELDNCDLQIGVRTGEDQNRSTGDDGSLVGVDFQGPLRVRVV